MYKMTERVNATEKLVSDLEDVVNPLTKVTRLNSLPKRVEEPDSVAFLKNWLIQELGHDHLSLSDSL